ncbi:unnamed protein product [Lymnaea stagnalis]|uniref:tRNA wybutosine-synthesizing protein 3 homolog n=1 Tax=Lymnaea stagnalis TaxID=6523 RepID=A0AAV2H4G8_LYMST
MATFSNQKLQRLVHVDLSKKGSVDDALIDIVDLINSLPQYFTTSSCSGRIILFENHSDEVQKKGCKWLYVSHDPVQLENISEALKDAENVTTLKFEPMVMHIQCQTLESAQKMHQAAVSSGFRNSGITIGTKGKIMMAVRSTHSLEAPLASEGQVLVSSEYIQFLIKNANTKMEENFRRITRFHKLLETLSPCEQCHQSLNGTAKKTRLFDRDADKSLKQDNRNQNKPEEEDEDLALFMFDIT